MALLRACCSRVFNQSHHLANNLGKQLNKLEVCNLCECECETLFKEETTSLLSVFFSVIIVMTNS